MAIKLGGNRQTFLRTYDYTQSLFQDEFNNIKEYRPAKYLTKCYLGIGHRLKVLDNHSMTERTTFLTVYGPYMLATKL